MMYGRQSQSKMSSCTASQPLASVVKNVSRWGGRAQGVFCSFQRGYRPSSGTLVYKIMIKETYPDQELSSDDLLTF